MRAMRIHPDDYVENEQGQEQRLMEVAFALVHGGGEEPEEPRGLDAKRIDRDEGTADEDVEENELLEFVAAVAQE